MKNYLSEDRAAMFKCTRQSRTRALLRMWRKNSSSSSLLQIGTLRCDDGDDNGNVKKATG